MPVCINH